MVDNVKFAEKAAEYKNSNIPYSVLDCQAFVEKVLQDCGLKKNWKGSNHMWREALSEKHEVENEPPLGAWLFTLKNDGGEKSRGYNDDEGNAAHVGIYVGNGKAMHSTTGGVQECDFPSRRWTHYGLCKHINYDGNVNENNNEDVISKIINEIYKIINKYLKGSEKIG